MCADGKELSCKRGATGANGKGLSCVKKRCVCKENSCYIAQTGQCVQDGCNVALAQVAAIQSVGGIGSPSAQAAALRAGHQTEEQSILQQEWMPPGKSSEVVRYLWSDALMKKAMKKAEELKASHPSLLDALTKHAPELNKPLTQSQVEHLQEALTKDLSDAQLMKELEYKTEEKVAYFWTPESLKWVVDEGKKHKATVKLFDPVKDKHHIEPGQSVSKKQMDELQKLKPADKKYDWRKASEGKFEEDEIVKATYRWKNEGISVFKGNDFKSVYNDLAAVNGPVRGNSIVQDMAVKAFEDRYGTMDRANKGGRLFSKEDEVSKVMDDTVLSTAQAEVAVPRYQTGLPVIVSRGSKTNNKELQDLASSMDSLSEKLENLADHRVDVEEPDAGSEEMQSVQGPALVAASFAPCLPRKSCAVSCRRSASGMPMLAVRARWSAFFPQVSNAEE